MLSSKNAGKYCYLCGRPISGKASNDHCPPRALFPEELRQRYNPDRLITFRVHRRCNERYARDEEYFVATMMPLARGSEAGEAVINEFFKKARNKHRKMRLAHKIYREFEERPGGLYLPPGWVVKRQEGVRIKRVAWKIVRGLNYYHHGSILQEDHSRVTCDETPPGQKPSEVFLAAISLSDDKTHGRYPGVFDYRFRVDDLPKMNHWAFFLWDRIIIEVYFHNPWFCQCAACTADLAEIKKRMGEPPAAAAPS